MKLLITGGFGLIGSRLLEIWGNQYEITVLDMTDSTATFKNVTYLEVDITQEAQVKKVVLDVKPDWIAHLAAYTDVEKAEVDREACWDLNVNATSYLAEAAKENSCQVVYLSTGFVFEGTKEEYTENDNEGPVNYYGLTKLEGERALRQVLPEACVLRINYPYRSAWDKKGDTIRWMVPKLLGDEEVTLVDDQFISPTFIDDIAVVLDKVFEKNSSGVYHVTPNECLSFFEIGKMLAQELGVNQDLIKPTKLDELLLKLGRKAVQPRRSCLVSNKIEQELGVKMTSVEGGLKKVKESYEEIENGKLLR